METVRLSTSEITADDDFNSRKAYKEELIEALANDIAKTAQYNPLIVRKLPKGGYSLISGFTRYRAVLLLNKRAKAEAKERGAPFEETTLFCQVMEADDKEAHLTNLAENVMRADLTSYEKAVKMRFLRDTYEMKGPEIARRTGEKSASTVNNLCRILDKCAPPLIDAWAEGRPGIVTDWLLKCATMSHEEQLARYATDWQAIDEDDGDDDDGDSDGHASTTPGKGGPKRPPVSSLDAALLNLGKAESINEQWRDGCRAALRFAAGRTKGIAGVWKPKDTVRGVSKGGARGKAKDDHDDE